MTKEYTGPEFEVEFARADYEWKKGGKVGPNPQMLWEYKNTRAVGMDWTTHHHYPSFYEYGIYRWKPKPKRMVTIGYADSNNIWRDRTLIAPEMDAPAVNEKYWLCVLQKPVEHIWHCCDLDRCWLESGCVFLTREDADAMAEWLAVCRRGGAT